MKYVIIGAGPTGLSLAHALAANNYEVDIIERDSQLGGSWNSQWKDGKYFSENSPRVLGYTKTVVRDFFYNLGMTSDDFSNVYGNILEANKKLIYFLKILLHLVITLYLYGVLLIIKLLKPILQCKNGWIIII